MKKAKNPAQGGRYVKASPDAAPILVSGTDRQPSDQDKRALEAMRKPKAQSTTKDGGDKL